MNHKPSRASNPATAPSAFPGTSPATHPIVRKDLANWQTESGKPDEPERIGRHLEGLRSGIALYNKYTHE
ncbi:hypothetical protein ACFFK0_04350 [Paenibacillus chartarius]|uniref:Uncharacterized protein n=1 Tax=Paenibacillus chartarius TaxID=747481 RepID=A0ABV6DGC4_9BACL